MKEKKMPVAEEVFLIVRELSKDGSFRWKDWKRAWSATSVRWRFAGYMSAGIALKSQVLYGTIKRIDRGLYFFVSSAPKHPLYTPEKFRPYDDTRAAWRKAAGY